MKKITFIIILLLSILVFNTQCDKIEKPYSEKGNELDTPAFPALQNVIQKYLLEDFTGHLCVNCPQAHAIADEMKTELGDTLIVWPYIRAITPNLKWLLMKPITGRKWGILSVKPLI